MNWVVSCTRCGSSYVYESGQGLPDICSACFEKGKKEVKKFLEKEQKRKEIISISTPEFANRKIVKTLGIVSNEHIFGVGLVKVLATLAGKQRAADQCTNESATAPAATRG